MAVNPVVKLGRMGDGAAPADQMPVEFGQSMAAAIERAFDVLRQAEGMPALALDDNTGTTRDRRLLFVAIAQGIYGYLHSVDFDPVLVQGVVPLPHRPDDLMDLP